MLRLVLAGLFLAPVAAAAQQHVSPAAVLQGQDHQLGRRVAELERGLEDAKRGIDDAAGSGMVLFLFGAFCALWAQDTGRNAWLWFFLGAFFSVATVLVLLAKNSAPRTTTVRNFDLKDYRVR